MSVVLSISVFHRHMVLALMLAYDQYHTKTKVFTYLILLVTRRAL